MSSVRIVLSGLMLAATGSACLADPSEPYLGGRVINGVKVNIAAYRWQVAISVKKSGKTWMCGGTLLSDKWVLTAAHCTDGAKVSDVAVKAGSDTYTGGTWIPAARVEQAAPFDDASKKDDVALIKTVSALTGGEPIGLASSMAPDGTELEVTGWGVTEKGTPSNDLRMVKVPVISKPVCNETESNNKGILDGMFCAGYQKGQKDSCSGDSGGPAVLRSGGGEVTLVGIVSWGAGCAEENKYGVYADVAYYRPWILKTLAADED